MPLHFDRTGSAYAFPRDRHHRAHAHVPLLRAEEDEPVPPNVRDAVDRALIFLKDNQRPDGTWQAGQASSTAVPSLAVMAFLARGHVPGQGPYGELLNRTIDYVLSMQRPSGLLSKAEGGNAVMYEHGISTVMLSEVYGMVDDTRRARIEKALAKAVKLRSMRRAMPEGTAISGRLAISAQQRRLGHLLHRLAAHGASRRRQLRRRRPREQRSKPGANTSAAAPSNGGGFSYQPGGPPNQARTGTGILSMELLGQHNSPEAKAAGD